MQCLAQKLLAPCCHLLPELAVGLVQVLEQEWVPLTKCLHRWAGVSHKMLTQSQCHGSKL